MEVRFPEQIEERLQTKSNRGVATIHFYAQLHITAIIRSPRPRIETPRLLLLFSRQDNGQAMTPARAKSGPRKAA